MILINSVWYVTCAAGCIYIWNCAQCHVTAQVCTYTVTVTVLHRCTWIRCWPIIMTSRKHPIAMRSWQPVRSAFPMDRWFKPSNFKLLNNEQWLFIIDCRLIHNYYASWWHGAWNTFKNSIDGSSYSLASLADYCTEYIMRDDTMHVQSIHFISIFTSLFQAWPGLLDGICPCLQRWVQINCLQAR